MNVGRHPASGTDQRSVSFLGWALTLVGGVLIWALIFVLTRIQ